GGALAIISYGADKAEILKGSALALAEDIVVTAYHVVSQAADIEVTNIKGKKVKVDGLLGVNKALDIALIKLKSKVQALPIGSVDSLTPDARLFALGSNESGQLIIAEGTFRRIVDIPSVGKVLEVSMPVPDQFRGGPLLDINGQLVGMMVMLERLKFGLPIGTLVSVPRTGPAVPFKSQAPVNFFDTAEGNYFGARVARGLNESMAARVFLEKAIKINPSDLDANLMLADIAYDQRDYSAAAAAYRKASELNPTSAPAFYGLGSTLLKQTQYQEAAQALEKAAALGHTGKALYLDLGGTYEALQDYAKAAAAYEKYIGLGPADAWKAEMSLGVCRTKLGDFPGAIAALTSAAKTQPRDLKVLLALTEAYEKAGQLEKAESTYIAMAEINPPEAKTYYRQIYRIYDAAGRNDRAVAPAQKVIELEPDNETNHYYLGLTYFKAQKYEEAIGAFQKALAAKADFPHAWFQIGSSYIQMKKFREAADAYKKYADLVPDDPSGWLSIGVAYMQAKDFEAALPPLKKCVELKPDNAVAQFNLAIVYVNLKDNFSAKEIYNKLQTLDPALAERLRKHIR
ncbi:MAG TPA: tetratricopeptide repeat protein, partial [Acidobacteriota bacterium]|nr:tetratricopeptide repeat protein [Acidobacteriota bacterium]